jgi:DNA polymerase V
MLVDLQSNDVHQDEFDFTEGPDLAGTVVDSVGAVGRDRDALMATVDTVNGRFGRGTLKIASAGFDLAPKRWAMRQDRKTPGYTTCWEELPIAKA